MVRSRLGQPGGYTSEGPYNEVSGYTSDNHYDRSAAEDKVLLLLSTIITHRTHNNKVVLKIGIHVIMKVLHSN